MHIANVLTAKLRIKIVRKGIATRRSIRGIPTIVASRLDGSRCHLAKR